MKTQAIETDVEERRKKYFERSKKTNGYDFATYRNQIMTEEQRQIAEDILRDFRASYRAKEQAGVYEDMRIAESYWSGEFENASADARANTNIINTNIETQVVDMLDQNIDVEPHPYDPSDAQYIPRVRQITDKILENNQIPLIIQRHMRRVKKFGNAWLRVLFNPKKLEGQGCPEIKSISPANVFPDASISQVDDVNKGRYFIEIFTAPIYWAEQTFGMEKASAIYPSYKPYAQELNFTGDIDTTGEKYIHMLYWTKYKDEKTGKQKLRLIQCSGCGVILRDSLEFSKEKGIDAFIDTEEVRFPYWVMNDMERENSIWGKSNASLLYPVQDLIDELDNQVLANARLNGNPKRLVVTSSGIDPDTIDNTEGQVIVSRMANGLQTIEAPNLPSYIINRRTEAMNNERAIVSRVSDQQSGQKQSGVDTATEALALQQNALKAVDATKTILQLMLADIMMYCIELAIEFWDTNMYFNSIDNAEKFDYFTPSMLQSIPEMIPASNEFKKAFKVRNPNAEEPKYMEKRNEKGESSKRKIHVILSVSVGAGLPKNKALMYNIIKETFANGAMSQDEYRKKLEEYVGLPYDESMNQQQQGGTIENQVEMPLGTQSRNIFNNNGVNKNALNKMQEQRTGGNYNVTK